MPWPKHEPRDPIAFMFDNFIPVTLEWMLALVWALQRKRLSDNHSS